MIVQVKMEVPKNKVGLIFGNWTIMGRDYDYAGNNAKYICHCICGESSSVFLSNLTRGRSTGCRSGGCHWRGRR